MSRSKRNTVRLVDIYRRVFACVDIMSDRLGPYIQLLRTNGVNAHTRYCSVAQWSGTIGDDDYSEAPCMLEASISRDGSIFVCACLYDGHCTEGNPLGLLIKCIDVPLSYYEKQLNVTKPNDIGMSILINVK